MRRYVVCGVAVPGGPRYAGPRWCSPSTMLFCTGAKPVRHVLAANEHVQWSKAERNGMAKRTGDSDTFVRANGSHVRSHEHAVRCRADTHRCPNLQSTSAACSVRPPARPTTPITTLCSCASRGLPEVSSSWPRVPEPRSPATGTRTRPGRRTRCRSGCARHSRDAPRERARRACYH